MSLSKVARVYATALYEAADEEGRVTQVDRDLAAFVEAVKASKELRQFLAAEEISAPRKKQVLLELTEGADVLLQNFLCLLVDKGRETELLGIYQGFVQLRERAQGIVHVEVVTAVPLTTSLQEALKTRIESTLKKTVALTLTVDQEILGGLRLRIGDRIVDASVRRRLDKLRELLTSPMSSLEGSVETAS